MAASSICTTGETKVVAEVMNAPGGLRPATSKRRAPSLSLSLRAQLSTAARVMPLRIRLRCGW